LELKEGKNIITLKRLKRPITVSTMDWRFTMSTVKTVYCCTYFGKSWARCCVQTGLQTVVKLVPSFVTFDGWLLLTKTCSSFVSKIKSPVSSYQIRNPSDRFLAKCF
jgi:hypothetical protein